EFMTIPIHAAWIKASSASRVTDPRHREADSHVLPYHLPFHEETAGHHLPALQRRNRWPPSASAPEKKPLATICQPSREETAGHHLPALQTPDLLVPI